MNEPHIHFLSRTVCRFSRERSLPLSLSRASLEVDHVTISFEKYTTKDMSHTFVAIPSTEDFILEYDRRHRHRASGDGIAKPSTPHALR